MLSYLTQSRALKLGAIVSLIATVLGSARVMADTDAATVAAMLQARFENAPEGDLGAPDRGAVKAFYAARGYRPVWVDETGPTRAATRIISELSHAPEWGLSADDFGLDAVKQPMPEGRWSASQTAEAELELVGAILRYARQARGGRIPEPAKQLSSFIDRRPLLPDITAVLEQISIDPNPDQALRAFQPQHDQFFKLKSLLQSLRFQASKQEESGIRRNGPVLSLGDRHPDVAALRRRLNLGEPSVESDRYDAGLAGAIKRFQAENSLRVDGIVGPATRQALNADLGEKIRAVIANMEAWRWMPEDLGEAHIFVNVPAFSLDYIENGIPKFHDRVVVGQRGKQTPIFSMPMTSIVLRPEWYLPDSIKLEKLVSGGRSLESRGYVVRRNGRTIKSWKIDWSKAALSHYEIYQPSGDSNALGLVKFLFPNKHSVYLHDTPSKSLFNASQRLFSHGCVRVKNPLKLAQALLDADNVETRFDVPKLARIGPGNNKVVLQRSIPVHIGYFTVWIDVDGKTRYLQDPYGHQERILLALDEKWDQLIDKGVDHPAVAADSARLKNIRYSPPGRSAQVKKIIPSGKMGLAAPTGPTTTPQTAWNRSSGVSVGEMIRRSLVD